jgi:Ca-activated chloride channel family protein
MTPLPSGHRKSRKNHSGDDGFGLIAWLEKTRLVLPLKAVDVSFDVSGDLAEVSLDQVFHQTSSRPLDVLYTFPLPAEAAVFRCELIVNDRIIQARVEEQVRAKEIARTMKAAGHRTGLVEMERDNVFTLSLGNVQPDDLIIVRFAWFQILDHSQNTKSLLIPFTPGVRYIPGKPLLRSNRGKGVQDDTDQVPDASRISPPRIDELHPDGALISLQGKLDGRFIEENSVSSGTHPVLVRDEKEHLSVSLPQQGHVPDRDFVLRWKEAATASLQLRSISCTDPDHQYTVIRIDAPANAPVAADRNRDYYFLVDRSGSMAGAKWTCTARALKAFIHELGEQDRVWVTLFETSFQDFAEAPLPVSELKNDPAFSALEELGTGGGTELLPALQHLLTPLTRYSRDRDPVIIVITDGQIGNEVGVTELLRNHSDLAVHTFGIDSAVNDAFLKNLAAQHRGACVLMTPNDDIEGAVSRLGNRLRRPVLTGLTVPTDWKPASNQLPDIYAGEHILVALRGSITASALEVSGQLADQSRKTFRFELKPEPVSTPRLLWARQTIDTLLAQGKPKEAIALAIKHNLICEGAAFIAYDVEEKVALAVEEIYQPAMEPDVLRCALPAAPVALPSVEAARPSVRASASSFLHRLRSPSPAKSAKFEMRSEPSGRLHEIEGRYSATHGQLNLRTQILLDKWKKQADQLPIFKGSGGKVLRDLLSLWAKDDLLPRIELLNGLLESLRKANGPAPLKAFVHANIDVADFALADDLNWLVKNLNQGAP